MKNFRLKHGWLRQRIKKLLYKQKPTEPTDIWLEEKGGTMCLMVGRGDETQVEILGIDEDGVLDFCWQNTGVLKKLGIRELVETVTRRSRILTRPHVYSSD